MSHYKSNLRDIEFNLFEANKLDGMLGAEPFADFDRDTVMDIVREIDRLAKDEFSESFVEADRVPLELVDGEVELTPSLARTGTTPFTNRVLGLALVLLGAGGLAVTWTGGRSVRSKRSLAS